MLKRGLSGQVWPIHFKPEKDELLSSWLTRLSIAHGMVLSGFLSIAFRDEPNPHRFLNLDIDLSLPANLLNLLANRTGTCLDKVISTTLRNYQGLWYERSNLKGKTQWIIPISSRFTYKVRGIQYCPQCLSEDHEPFFRRSWRLASTVLCVKHQIQILDCCVGCGHGVNFRRGFKHASRQGPLGSITSCSFCGLDLRKAVSFLTPNRPSKEEVEFQKLLMEGTERGWVEIDGIGAMYSHLYFAVLNKLVALLLTRSKGPSFREKISHASSTEMFSISCSTRNRVIGDLNVYDRRRLLDMARWLLTDWPQRFISFCKSNKIGCNVMGNSTDMPFWYCSVVREHLDRTNYKPLDEEIESATTLYRGKLSEERYEWSPTEINTLLTFLGSIDPSRKSKVFRALNVPNMVFKINRKSLHVK